MDQLLFSLLAQASLLGGGGNEGALVPIDDVSDLRSGATHIPGEVTDARRRGERVVYFPAEKKWRMPDGTFRK